MPEESSESLLKALEHSKQDPNTLLDQAASIAGVVYDEEASEYISLNKNKSKYTQGFREQWLLRWTVKKLNEAVQLKPSDTGSIEWHQFIVNARTWALLTYLISTIPTSKALDILLERNFTKLLMNVGTFILEYSQSFQTNNAVNLTNGDDYERPRKRLRLSPVTNGVTADNGQQTSPTNALILSQFIRSVYTWSQAIQPGQYVSSSFPRSVTPAWADSIKDAGSYVGLVLHCLRLLLGLETKQDEMITLTATQWLRIWHIFATSNNAADKNATYKAFNDLCLIPCLDLYDILSTSRSARLTSVKKEIERQIALYTILPMRSIFNERYAVAWKSDRGTVSWKNIEPVYRMTQKNLGAALKIESITEAQNLISLPNPRFATSLVLLASRIIPKEDIRKRQSETPWLEAFTLSIAHLTFPRSMPEMLEDSEKGLRPAVDELPPSVAMSNLWPDDLLNVIWKEEMNFSLPVKEYLVASVLNWRNRPLPISSIRCIVDLDIDIFVPSIGGSSAATCLDNLLATISDMKALNEDQYNVLISEIINPLLEVFAKARDFDKLLDLWLSGLEEALRRRVTSTFTLDSIPPMLAWSDEDVFSYFIQLCRLSAPTSIVHSNLAQAVDALKDLSERVGPTSDIFARLAILESVLKAKSTEKSAITENFTLLETLRDLLAESLQQQNDYQGQRWRLWNMLNLLSRLDARLDRFDIVAAEIEEVNKRFGMKTMQELNELPYNQLSSMLKEQQAIFSLLVKRHASKMRKDDTDDKTINEMLKKENKKLGEMIKLTRKDQSQDAKESISTSRRTLWNGRLNNLRGTEQLVDGHFACLLQQPTLLSCRNTSHIEVFSPLQKQLEILKGGSSQNSSRKSLQELIFVYLEMAHPNHMSRVDLDTTHEQAAPGADNDAGSVMDQRVTEVSVDRSASNFQKTLSDVNTLQKLELLKDISQVSESPNKIQAALAECSVISVLEEDELSYAPDVARMLKSKVSINLSGQNLSSSDIVSHLERSMLILKTQPGIINQATVDELLKDLAIFSSAAFKVEVCESSGFVSQKPLATSIFNRLVGITGTLLARYRRRLTGRTHLLLSVFQNLLKCLFYTPNRAYLYQNAATSKQKQAFRSSLPSWLTEEPLSASSAVKFTKLVTSICNPTTASARSANRNKRKKDPTSLELNDETKKARRIAAQYMQYLIMEYARCSLDGVIQPDVREKLLPGLFSILDAMDRDLMGAMNAAMDPSSRAIFKGLYDDWMKHWKWDQN